MTPLTHADYTNLLEFRTALRRFENWSRRAAGTVGLTAGQHQLLLAVTGHPGEMGPTISELADYLLVRHHSAVGLIDRAVKAGLVQRGGDPHDARTVRLSLTALGQQRIEQLSEQHLAELARLLPLLEHLSADSAPSTT
jgi:DNA-binding MarR family transcriptional regulator